MKYVPHTPSDLPRQNDRQRRQDRSVQAAVFVEPRQRDELALVRSGNGDGSGSGLAGGRFHPGGGRFRLGVRRLQLERVLRAREQAASVRNGVHALVAGQLAADVRRLVRVIVAVAPQAEVVLYAAGRQDGFVVVVLLRPIPIAQRHKLRSVADGLSRCRRHRSHSHRSRRAASLLAVEQCCY